MSNPKEAFNPSSCQNCALETHLHVPLHSLTETDTVNETQQIRSVERGDEEVAECFDHAFSLMAAFKSTLKHATAEIAISLFRQTLTKRPATHPLHHDATVQLAYALNAKFMHTGQMVSLLEAMKLYLKIPQTFFKNAIGSNMAHVTSQEDQETQNMLDTAIETLTSYLQSTSLDSINVIAILLQTSLAKSHSSVHPKRVTALLTLAASLYYRFHHSRDTSDLKHAINHLQDALRNCSPKDTDRLNIVHQLCALLMTRLHFGGQVSDLMEAGALFKREHVNDTGSSATMKLARGILAQASSMQEQFRDSGDMTDLNKAIVLYRQAQSGMPSSFSNFQIYHLTSNNLANALLARFRLGGQQSDLDEAILLHRQTLKLRDLPHPKHADSLCNLANALMTQFEQSGRWEDLDEAISLHNRCLTLHPPQESRRPIFLNSLANALKTRFEQTDQRLEDISEAINLYRQALELVKLAPPDPGYIDSSLTADTLTNLANSLLSHFERTGCKEDLDEAILTSRQAYELRPLLHPDRPDCIGNFANALMTRFQQNGERSDLDKAISLHREGLDLLPSSHPRRCRSLSNLSDALLARFDQSGFRDRADLDEAIIINRDVLDLQLRNHPDRSYSVNNLANALWSRYITDIHGGKPDDLVEAGVLYREALELSPPSHPYRPDFLSNLGNTLMAKFSSFKRPEDLDEAILLYRDALNLKHPTRPDRPYSLNNLSNALETRFEKLDHKPGDFDEAISLQRQALALIPLAHYLRSRLLETLGDMYIRAHPFSGDPLHIEESMLAYSLALECPSQCASGTLRVAKAWSAHADRHNHPTAIEAYAAALQSLLQVASLELDIQSRQDILRCDGDGLARQAARYAIQENELEKAIEYLEGGRTIFWSQVMHLRSPLDKLRHTARELAERLQNIAYELERGSHRNSIKTMTGSISDNRSKLTLEQEASRYRRLGEQWRKCVEEVRQLDGFQDFLLPRSFATIQLAAAHSPVVFLVPNDKCSDCLVMTSKLTHHIPLSDLPNDELRRLVYLVRLASSQSIVTRASTADSNFASHSTVDDLGSGLLPSDERASRRGGSSISSDEVFRDVLNVLWKKVVKPVLEILGLQKSKTPSTLQWCPTGLFAFLPVHAAGCYDSTTTGLLESTLDYVVSSYTPTAGILLQSQGGNNVDFDSHPFKMMVVIDTNLAFAKMELEKIKQQVPSNCLVQLGIPQAPALVDVVYSGLQSASIVHFACHGWQDESNPLDSALLMHGRELLKISKIVEQPLPRGSLAFLCACETSKGDSQIPDEALSLGASLLFSGFRSVIATMWRIRDSDGPTIAETFYEELFRGPDGKPTGLPDVSKSARALHNAVQKLRSGDVEFRRWVPFVHIGNAV